MLLLGLAAIVILFTVLWAVSLRQQNCSIADVAWGPGILLIGLIYYFTSKGGTLRAHLTLALLAIWAIRLATHLYFRMRLQGEDFRYVKWRDDYDHWWLVSYPRFSRRLVGWIISLPIYFTIVWWRFTDVPCYLGVLLFVAGMVFEASATSRLRRFRPTAPIAVLDTGLWRYAHQIGGGRWCGGGSA